MRKTVLFIVAIVGVLGLAQAQKEGKKKKKKAAEAKTEINLDTPPPAVPEKASEKVEEKTPKPKDTNILITLYQREAPVKVNTVGVYPKMRNNKTWPGHETGSYNIRFKIKGIMPGDTVFLADHFQDGKYLRDTTVVDKKGVATFTGNYRLQRGMYLFVLPGRRDFFEFIVDDDLDFQINTDTNYYSREYYKNMVVEGSAQNTAFATYQSGRVKLLHELYDIEQEIKSDTQPERRKALMTRKKDLALMRENYDENYIRSNPSHLLSHFLYAMKDVEVPEELPLLADGTRDSAFPFRYYKTHYWDHIDLGDDGLIRMPVHFLKTRLDYYFDKLVSPDPDSLIAESQKLLNKAKNTVEIERFLVMHLTNKFESSKIMGQDKAFVYMALSYYCNGKAWWTDSATLSRMCDAANRMKYNTIGEKAPALEHMMPDSSFFNTASIVANYTIMMFWDPTCGHCREVMPKLHKIYLNKKDQGWKVIALSSGDKMKEWYKYLEEHPEIAKDFIHVTRGIVRNDYWKNQLQMYYIYASPTIFVLDKDKKILANRIDVEKIEEFIDHVEKVNARKAGK